MSEVLKTEDRKSGREPYTIEVEAQEFNPDFSGKYLNSMDFARLTNAYFKIAFADYVGSKFEISNGAPSISLFFDHAKTAEGTYACERIADKTVGNTILDKTRSRDFQMKEGDRYHLTADGEDIIKSLLYPRFYNQGKPHWKQIVSDVTDRTAASFYQPQNVQQLTKVVGIDPKAICKIIWGATEEDEEGKESYVDYDVTVKANLTQGMMNANPTYLLEITKAFTGQITKTYESLGLGMVGSSIIR